MTTDTTYTPPPFDPEVEPALSLETALPPSADLETLISRRGSAPMQPVLDAMAARDIEREDRSIPGPERAPDLTISVWRKHGHKAGGPGFYWIHAGGMVTGDRFASMPMVMEWVDRFDGVAVSIDYRLAPENPDPAPVEDCYAGLCWMAEHAEELGYNPDQLLCCGSSGGGGLAAGTVLLARDRGTPAVFAQMLIWPMIDDRNDTFSAHQMEGVGIWDLHANEAGWTALLGDRRGTNAVSIYAAPARAHDLSGLPPAYVECTSVETFRDEDVAYANRIWQAGGICDLHVWAGGFHGVEGMVPNAAISVAMRQTRINFLQRVLRTE
jgi:acetyl esterase/lipase